MMRALLRVSKRRWPITGHCSWHEKGPEISFVPCYATVTFWAVTSPRPLDHLPQLLIQGIHFIHLFLERCRLFTHQFQLLFMQCFLGLGLLKRNELVMPMPAAITMTTTATAQPRTSFLYCAGVTTNGSVRSVFRNDGHHAGVSQAFMRWHHDCRLRIHGYILMWIFTLFPCYPSRSF